MTRVQGWVAVLLTASAAACSGSDEDPPRQSSFISGSGTGGTGSTGGAGAQGGTGGNGSGAQGSAGGIGGSGGKGGMSGSSNATGGSGSGAGRGGSDGSGGDAGSAGMSSGSSSGTGGSGAGRGGSGSAGMPAGSGGKSASGGKSGSGGSAGASPSDGCSDGAKPARGHYTITAASKERGYFLVPAAEDGPVPLVFEFHGAGGNGEGVLPMFNVETALGGAAVIIAPDGVSQGGTIGWSTGGNDNEDIQLVRALIEQAKQDHCIDTTRIFALGFSWGGWMATQVGCALGPDLRGFVSVAGGGPSGTCTGPTGAMIVHGSMDDAEPVASGISSRNKFRSSNGCTDTLSASDVTGCQAYAGCSKLTLWCEHTGGHFVPQFVIDGMSTFFDSI